MRKGAGGQRPRQPRRQPERRPADPRHDGQGQEDGLYGAPEGGNELRSDLINAPGGSRDVVHQLRLRGAADTRRPQPNGVHLAPRYLQLIWRRATGGRRRNHPRAYSDYKERFVARVGCARCTSSR
jgi:hypothetical protein